METLATATEPVEHISMAETPRHRRMARSSGLFFGRLAFAAAAVACWQLVVVTGLLPRTSVPTASATATALSRMVRTSGFWQATGQTMIGWGVGLLICLAVAIPVGLVIGTSPFLTRSTRLLIDFLRTIPAVAVIPVLLLTLGPTLKMKLVLVVLGSVWPLLTSTIDGVRNVDPLAAEMVRSLRLSAWHRARVLVFPTALPFVITGARISTVLALMLATAGEYLGSAPGIGKQLGEAQSVGSVDVMFGWLLVAGVLGVALNTAFLLLDRMLLPWVPANRKRIGP